MHWLRKVQPGGSFVGQGFCALAHEPAFMDNLSADDKAYVLDSINKALPGLAKYPGPDVSYSNIYFMGEVNCVICGEAPGVNATLGAATAAHGYDTLLANWVNYSHTAGNHEFNSPTYYWVQMNALALGCMYAKRPEGKHTFCQILTHVWANVAANWFEPTETMTGAHSRDYDFLYGHGALQVITYVNGLGTHAPVCEFRDAHCERTTDGQNALTLLNVLHARDGSGIGYAPPKDALALARLPVREVRSKWLGQKRTANNETAAQGDRSNFIVSGRYTVGSASSDYITNTHTPYFPGAQDKLVSINLAVTNMSQVRPSPSITIVPGWRDAPYGHWYEPITNKPSHLATHPGNVQHRNALLATSALNPTEQLDGFNRTVFDNLATSVIFPFRDAATILLNGVSAPGVPPRDAPVPFETPVHVGDVLAVRVERSCLAVRVVAADGCGPIPRATRPWPVVIVLKGDAEGLSLDAIRLTAYHYRGPKTTLTSSTHVRSAFVFLVDTCDGDAALQSLSDEMASADVREWTTAKGDVWTVAATLRGTQLKVSRDVSEPHCERWGCVLSRTINGTAVQPVHLEVNGKPVGPLP